MAKKDLLSGGKAVADEKPKAEALNKEQEKVQKEVEKVEPVEEIPEEEKAEAVEEKAEALSDEEKVEDTTQEEKVEETAQEKVEDTTQAGSENSEEIQHDALKEETEIEEKSETDGDFEDGEKSETEVGEKSETEGGDEDPEQEIDPNAVKNELMNRGRAIKVPKPDFNVKDVLRQRQETGKQVKMTPKQEIEYRKRGLSPKQELKRRRNITK